MTPIAPERDGVPRGATLILRIPEGDAFRLVAQEHRPSKSTLGEELLALGRSATPSADVAAIAKPRRRGLAAGGIPRAIVDRLGRRMTVCVRLAPEPQAGTEAPAAAPLEGSLGGPRRTR